MARAALLIFVAAFTPALAYVLPTDTSFRRSEKLTKSAAVHLPDAPAGTWNDPSPVKSSWSPLVLGLALGVFAAAVGQAPAALADAGKGQTAFEGNCAACHAGGKNIVSPGKPLTKEALEKFNRYEAPSIASLIAKGAGSMPGFGTKLAEADIADIADYVRSKADAGW